MHITHATPAYRDSIRALLMEARLPTGDLDEAKPLRFWVVRANDGRLSGVVGLEQYGHAGLLRSLAVSAALRKQGLGASLTTSLEQQAKGAGVEALYLLTMTAERFFRARGYQHADRAQVPREIGETREFKMLCPLSAACLWKKL